MPVRADSPEPSASGWAIRWVSRGPRVSRKPGIIIFACGAVARTHSDGAAKPRHPRRDGLAVGTAGRVVSVVASRVVLVGGTRGGSRGAQQTSAKALTPTFTELSEANVGYPENCGWRSSNPQEGGPGTMQVSRALFPRRGRAVHSDYDDFLPHRIRCYHVRPRRIHSFPLRPPCKPAIHSAPGHCSTKHGVCASRTQWKLANSCVSGSRDTNTLRKRICFGNLEVLLLLLFRSTSLIGAGSAAIETTAS
jgi:hypothetical protein